MKISGTTGTGVRLSAVMIHHSKDVVRRTGASRLVGPRDLTFESPPTRVEWGPGTSGIRDRRSPSPLFDSSHSPTRLVLDSRVRLNDTPESVYRSEETRVKGPSCYPHSKYYTTFT